MDYYFCFICRSKYDGCPESKERFSINKNECYQQKLYLESYNTLL